MPERIDALARERAERLIRELDELVALYRAGTLAPEPLAELVRDATKALLTYPAQGDSA